MCNTVRFGQLSRPTKAYLSLSNRGDLGCFVVIVGQQVDTWRRAEKDNDGTINRVTGYR